MTAEREPLEVTQLLLGILDEGRRTATYKLAVLLALFDCCALGSDADGSAPAELTTRQLAERVVELYWPQVRLHGGSGRVLRQTSQRTALTVAAVSALREAAQGTRANTVAMAARVLPEAYARCLAAVELNLARMPLGKLQRPQGYLEADNSDYPRFLYDDAAFTERVRARDLPLPIRLQPGVGDALVSVAGLVRPLVELHWLRDVSRFNRLSLAEDNLREFLFGSHRMSLDAVRPGLVELQEEKCFYCRRTLTTSSAHVDHFVPWSRVPNDGLANLVAADARCNGGKSDHYADLDLVQRWNERPRAGLSELERNAGWPLQRSATLGSIRSLYGHLPTGARLWSSPGTFTLLDAARRNDLLPELA
ncbi:MAG: hypothetical protein QOJ32_1993 [Frankiaceae bacterium]|jgi:hypothetical protein|nr:hypothetical protein [Frankiaceae bacterium]